MENKWAYIVGDEGLYQIRTDRWRTFKPVMDKSKCNDCGICAYYCPVGSICREEEGSSILAIELSYCKGCGICAKECPRQAILMVREEFS